MKYKCPCCGNFTLDIPPPGTYEVCQVCYWEDDPVQFHNPDYEGGANKISLKKARTNYQSFGASSQEFLKYVRSPKESEKPR